MGGEKKKQLFFQIMPRIIQSKCGAFPYNETTTEGHMSSVVARFLVNPRHYPSGPGSISGKYPLDVPVCQPAALYLFCNYSGYSIDEFWAGFLPLPGKEKHQLPIRFSSLGSNGFVENLLCCGQDSDTFPMPDVWRKDLSPHSNLHIFFHFFLVHKPFPGCRDTPAWLW